MLHTNEKLIKNKVGLLNLGQELGNVSKACKLMGFSRETFYRYQHAVAEGGVDALLEKTRRKPNLKNRVDEQVEQAVLDIAIEFPVYGQLRTSNELRKRGIFVSPSGVRSIWLRYQLANRKQRLDALEKKSAKEGWVLTEAQVAAFVDLEKYLNKELKKEKISEKTLKNLKTIPGIGPILATTIYLETGPIQRFPEVGNYVSYCRCVSSERLSNGKKKGENNRKNGNAYLCWSYVEAANHAVRCAEPIQRYYQRKRQKGNHTLAIKAVAHKLARASYYILKNGVPFDIKKAFN